jgi:hypothetical protein
MTPREGAHLRRLMASRTAIAILVAAAAMLLAACGGSHKAPTKASTTAPPPHGPTARALAETISEAHGAQPSPSIRAAPGGVLEFHTSVPGIADSPAVKVSLTFVREPATSWKVTASADGQKASAIVTSANGKPLTLVRLGYTCALPPAASLCPAQHVAASATHVRMQFSAQPGSNIELVAIAGPVTEPASGTSPPGTLVVPAYALTELVEAIPAPLTNSGAPTKLKRTIGTAVTAQPGYTVALRTEVAGVAIGAPQPATISFSQGPGTTINVSVSDPGGKTASATIKSASGSPITIVLPRYPCYVPPTPTSCPAVRIRTSPHHYAVTFRAWPKMPPIVIDAQVESG